MHGQNVDVLVILLVLQDREVFLANLRKISHLQKINGQKYIILLEEYK
jgi:hypothetical protein